MQKIIQLLDKLWDVAIIMHGDSRLEPLGNEIDSPGLNALKNKLPQAIQAYFNITGEKLNVVVVTSTWTSHLSTQSPLAWYEYTNTQLSDDNVTKDITDILCLGCDKLEKANVPSQECPGGGGARGVATLSPTSSVTNKVDTIKDLCRVYSNDETDLAATVYYIK